MRSQINFFKDNGMIFMQFPREEGKPQRIDHYFVTRAGLSWPAVNSPGYYCILGLKDEPTLTDKKPLVLLAEGENKLMDKFFERLTANVKRLYCQSVWGDLEENNKVFEDSLRKFVRERKIEGVRLFDSSEFENFNHSIALINQYQHDGALVIDKDTILGKQIRSMTPDDLLDKPEIRFYAVSALSRVLGSFKDYPWRKSTDVFSGFSNIQQRGNSDDDGSYFESFVS